MNNFIFEKLKREYWIFINWVFVLWIVNDVGENLDFYCIINILFKWIYLCIELYDIIFKNDWCFIVVILGIKNIK